MVYKSNTTKRTGCISLRFLTPFLIIILLLLPLCSHVFTDVTAALLCPCDGCLRAFGSSDGRPLVRSEEVGLAGDSSGKPEGDVVWRHLDAVSRPLVPATAGG